MWNKIQRIYVGTNLVYPKTVPQNWLLWYRPLEIDVNDQSWNWKNLTKTWCSFWTIWDKAGIRLSTAYTDTPSDYLVTPDIWKPTTFSFCGRLYKTNNNTSGYNDRTAFFDNATSDTTNSLRLRAKYKQFRWIAYGWQIYDGVYTIPTNTWICLWFTSDGSTLKLYVNWILVYTGTAGAIATDASDKYYIWKWYFNSSQSRCWVWWIRHFALYNRELSADEIISYYNITS